MCDRTIYNKRIQLNFFRNSHKKYPRFTPNKKKTRKKKPKKVQEVE